MDSILTSIKKLLGISEEYEHFDPDIVMHINTVLSILTQLGVGPDTGFAISDKTTLWSDYLPDESMATIEMVKTYIYLKVKMMFDTSTMTGSAISSAENLISELEWRLNVAVDHGGKIDESE
jgi:hypothetical protein